MSLTSKKLMSASGGGDEGFDVFQAYLDDQNDASLVDTLVLGSISIGAKEGNGTGIYVSPDGTKLYVVGTSSDDANEYDLSRPFDTSSATFNQAFALNTNANNPQGIFFKDDGTKMFISTDDGTERVAEYALSTAWDVSTATYTDNLDVSAKVSMTRGIHFKPDGTEIFIADMLNKIFKYTLSTAWDVSTGTYDSEYSHTTDTQLNDVAFTSDGLTMLTIAADDDDVFKFSLSTAWDLSTVTYDSENLTLGSETLAFMLHISDDDQYIYHGGKSTDSVITRSWRGFLVRSQESLPYGITFKPDGTQMFISGKLEDGINAWDLSTEFDVTTATHSAGSGTLRTTLQGHAWKPDGTRLFFSSSEGYIFRYDLSTAWDVTTATIVQSLGFDYGSDSRGLSFNPDGTKLYVSEEDTNRVIQYTLGTAWALSPKTLDGYISCGTDPAGHLWNSDGTQFMVSVDQGIRIYDLSTAYDITTATENSESPYALLAGNTEGDLAWNDDGTKMYHLSQEIDKVYTYTVGERP